MSATIYTGYRNYTRFYLSWSVAQQDVPNNRSLINWTAGIQAQPGWSPYWGSNAIRLNSVSIDGSGNLASGTWSNITLKAGQTLPLRSGSHWIGHNADGSKAFGASVSGWFYGNGDVSASGSWGINTIPRNSQVTTNDSGGYNLDTPLTIYTNRKSGAFTHLIRVRHADTGYLIHEVGGVQDQTTFTPSQGHIDLMQSLIPNDNRIRLVIQQLNEQVGQWSEVGVWGYLRNANPLFSDFTYRDSNTAVTAITGNDQVLVKGKSTLETTITVANKMTAIKSATPRHYSIVYDGDTSQQTYSASTDVLASFYNVNSIGQRTIVASAFDSRNNNTSVSKQVTVYDYVAPTIETSTYRENNFGDDTTIDFKGTYTPLVIDGSAKNSIVANSVRYRYKEDGGTYGSWATRTFTAVDGLWSISATFVRTLDNTKKFVFEFQVADLFGTTTVEALVDVGRPIMFVGERSGSPTVGIGKMPENGGLDVNGDIFSSNRNLSMTQEVGVLTFGTDNIWQNITTGGSTYINYTNIEKSDRSTMSKINNELVIGTTGYYTIVANVRQIQNLQPMVHMIEYSPTGLLWANLAYWTPEQHQVPANTGRQMTPISMTVRLTAGSRLRHRVDVTTAPVRIGGGLQPIEVYQTSLAAYKVG